MKGDTDMSRRGENIYKRKDGRYEGRYVIGKNGNGKDTLWLCLCPAVYRGEDVAASAESRAL